MNGAEQQARHIAVQRAESRLDTLETIVTALIDEVGKERTRRLDLAREQRGYIDHEDRLLRQCCQERWNATAAANQRLFARWQRVAALTFWQRLSWLLFGTPEAVDAVGQRIEEPHLSPRAKASSSSSVSSDTKG